MKIIDALKNVIQPETNDPWHVYPPMEALYEELSLQAMYDEPEEIIERLRAYSIFKWTCTDETVGLEALYFDGEPVAALFREGRKMGYQIEWVSMEAALAVRQYLLSFEKLQSITILKPDAVVDTQELSYLAGRPFEPKVTSEGDPACVTCGEETVQGDCDDPECPESGR